MSPPLDKEPDLTIRDLYPHLNDEQLAEVEDTLERYLALVLRIFERRETEAESPGDRLTQDTGAVACGS